MEKTVERLRGWAQVSVSGGQPEEFLNECAKYGVKLGVCRSVSSAELYCEIPRRYLERARSCAQRAQCELKVLSRRGASYTLSRVKRRYVLLAGLMAVLLLLGFSGLYIWDIDLVGNEKVSSSEILGVLEDCGVYIGANWTAFSADRIRSMALERIPELSFLTVNVHGSRATVIVRERIEQPEMDYSSLPGNVVAKKSGVVRRINVFRGAASVAPGSAVLKGDVLISGTVPGLELWEKPVEYRSVNALGEVWAQTFYEFTAAAPLQRQEKVPTGRTAGSYALVFGGKRLNFYKNTGIYRSACDTIYNVWKLELKGLFTLPAALVRETREQYTLQTVSVSPAEAESELREELAARLRRETGEDAQILSADFTVRREEDRVYVTLKASCMENIALRESADINPREEDESQ